MSTSTDNDDCVAVVTGDIVGYSDLERSRREGLSDELREIYELLRSDLSAELPYDIAISGGDRWQWLVGAPEHSLAAAVAFVAHLSARGIETRGVIGVGAVEFMGDGNLHEADGSAFRASGRGLEEMPEGQYLQCAMPGVESVSAEIAADAIAECVDYIVETWTDAQARAVAGKSPQLYSDRRVTNADIGTEWSADGITKQAVGSHLNKAHWSRLVRTVDRFQQLIGALSP